MDCKCRGCRAGSINIQKRYGLRGTREPARAILAAGGDDQACLCEFRERFPDEGRIGLDTLRKHPRREFLAVIEAESCHDVYCDRELDASRGHQIASWNM